ncbi:MAG: hypothetical protein NTY38_01455, partial [Acidobacteria bacterium]|nr:hypothetical protein [Acidobacteriota bacterium]
MDPSRWLRIEKVYQAASEQKPEERAAFLAVACAGDEDLRREVESILAQPSADGMLDHPAWEQELGRTVSTGDTGRAAMIGRTISHYQIL